MLTVDYDRLGLQPQDRILDMGCGAGRHAFESLRRRGHVVALDMSQEELTNVLATFAAMVDGHEVEPDASGLPVRSDALLLPFPDDTFDRIIASEVLEHLPDDTAALAELARVLRPGGTMAVTVPSWFVEKLCWKLSDEYHAPKAVGGHVRIYKRTELQAKLAGVGLESKGSHRAHSLHSPYWWLKCAVGPANDGHKLVKAYHRLLVWDIVKGPWITRFADRLLNPILGKSIVLYAHKPDQMAPAGTRHGEVTSAA
jgi:SAM-dependent methyltransferase